MALTVELGLQALQMVLVVAIAPFVLGVTRPFFLVILLAAQGWGNERA